MCGKEQRYYFTVFLSSIVLTTEIVDCGCGFGLCDTRVISNTLLIRAWVFSGYSSFRPRRNVGGLELTLCSVF